MQLSGLLRVVCGRSFCAIVTLCSGCRASGRMAWLHLERRLSAVLCLLLIRRKGCVVHWRHQPSCRKFARNLCVRVRVYVCACARAQAWLCGRLNVCLCVQFLCKEVVVHVCSARVCEHACLRAVSKAAGCICQQGACVANHINTPFCSEFGWAAAGGAPAANCPSSIEPPAAPCSFGWSRGDAKEQSSWVATLRQTWRGGEQPAWAPRRMSGPSEEETKCACCRRHRRALWATPK